MLHVISKKAWLLPALWEAIIYLTAEKLKLKLNQTRPNQNTPRPEVTFKLLVQLWHNRGIRIDGKVKILRTTKTSSGLGVYLKWRISLHYLELASITCSAPTFNSASLWNSHLQLKLAWRCFQLFWAPSTQWSLCCLLNPTPHKHHGRQHSTWPYFTRGKQVNPFNSSEELVHTW